MNDQHSSGAIILAAVNEKGGVTKTTSTANLAVILSRLGLRVLAVDGDPQGHLTFTLYYYILIDTNPSLGVLTVNALCAAQSIFIPLVPEVLAVQGLGDLLQVVHQIQNDAINPDLTIAGIIFAKVQKYKGHQEIIASLRGDLSKELGISCFRTELRQSASFTNAANRRSVVVISDPYSEHSKDYWRLLAEVLEKAGGPAREPVQLVVDAIEADAH